MANYVMYGFCKSDIDFAGYLAEIPSSKTGKQVKVCDDIHDAVKFSESSCTGTPSKWLDYVNQELEELHGENAFKFHLVKTIL